MRSVAIRMKCSQLLRRPCQKLGAGSPQGDGFIDGTPRSRVIAFDHIFGLVEDAPSSLDVEQRGEKGPDFPGLGQAPYPSSWRSSRRTSASISASLTRKASIVRTAWITVV